MKAIKMANTRRLGGAGFIPTFLILFWVAGLTGPTISAAEQPAAYLDASQFSNLNAAVKSAVEKKAGGVTIPAGKAIGAEGPIFLPDDFVIAGADPSTSRIVFKSLKGDGFVLKGVRNVQFRNLIVDGSSVAASSPLAGQGVALTEVENAVFEGVTFLKMPWLTIVGSGHGVRIEGCRFLGGQGPWSIQINHGENWQMVRNQLQGSGPVVIAPSLDPKDPTPGLGSAGGGRGGIAILGGRNLLLLANLFEDTGEAIHIEGDGMQHSLIAGNFIPHNARGHSVYQVSGQNDGNVYAYNEFHGIGYGPDGKGTDFAATGFQTWSGGDNLIVGNLFERIGGYGINDSLNYQPLGNVFSDNVLYNVSNPVVLVNSSEGSTIRRNRIGPSSSLGVHLGIEVVLPYGGTIRYGAHNCWLVNNVIRGNAIPGVLAQMMTDGLIQGNRILDNGANLNVWPPEWRTPEGQSGIKLLWAPQFVGDNETANNRIMGNRISDTRTNLAQKTQRYGIWAGAVNPPGKPINTGLPFANQPIDPRDKLTFRNNTIRWNDLRGNRDEPMHFVPGANLDQPMDHNAVDEKTAAELKNGPALADAGPSLVVAGGSVVRLTAAATRFPEGMAPKQFQYSWRQETAWTQRRGPPIGIGGADTPTPTVSFPKVKEPTLYGFVLKVTRPNAKDPKAAEYTEDKVYVAVYDDEQHGPKLPATFDRKEPFSTEGPPGYRTLEMIKPNGWQWGASGGELVARLRSGSGAARLLPEGKIFGQSASLDLVSVGSESPGALPVGGSAGLVLVNAAVESRVADGYFLGLGRGEGEEKTLLKVIRLRSGLSVFGQLSGKGKGTLATQPWNGERLHLVIERLGERYAFFANGKLLAEDTQRLLEEPYFDGPSPTVAGVQVASLSPTDGKAAWEVHFDNLCIDHSASGAVVIEH